MRTAVFIRSYRKDFHWLDFCVKSIRKYLTGYSELVLVVPRDQKKLLNPDTRSAFDKIHLRTEQTHGYLDQQITKLRAHHYTDAERILFVDSDCVFFEPCSVDAFTRDDLPLILTTPYEVFARHQEATGKTENVLNWKRITEGFVGFDVQEEYMRRIPLMHDARTLHEIEQRYPQLVSDILKIRDNSLSEFNIMGAVAAKFLPELYYFQCTETEPLPPKYCEQYWSWGGMAKDLKESLQCVCK